MKPHLWYAGSYTNGEPYFQGAKGKGIVSFQFDPLIGEFSEATLEAELLNPSWIWSDGRHLFAVEEGFEKNSSLCVFTRYDDASLELADKHLLPGDAFCHGSHDQHRIGVSCYMDGWSQLFALSPEEKLSPMSLPWTYEGSGPHPRQEKPHAHQITYAKELRSWLVCDLGSDSVWIHDDSFQEAPIRIAVPKGCGPRHLCRGHTPGIWWLWCELEPLLIALDIRPGREPRIIHDINLSQISGCSEVGAGAAIHLHPSEAWIACSSRQDHSILIVDVHQPESPLLLSQLECPGETPRDFRFERRGLWLLSASQDEHVIQAFAMDPAGGISQIPFAWLDTESPVCLCQI